MTPSLLKRLSISNQATHITTLDMDGGGIQHGKDSRKMQSILQYLDYLALVHKSNGLVMPMRAYDLLLGLQWIPNQHPDFGWALLTPCDY